MSAAAQTSSYSRVPSILEIWAAVSDRAAKVGARIGPSITLTQKITFLYLSLQHLLKGEADKFSEVALILDDTLGRKRVVGPKGSLQLSV